MLSTSTEALAISNLVNRGAELERENAALKAEVIALSAASNTGSPKLSRFEELWDAYCGEYKFGDDASEHEICLSFYDIIARQLRAGA
jgi:hypothetical protein